MSDLASALDMALSTATRTVDKLIVKQLVDRRRLDEDRRVVKVRFSKRGREIHRFVVSAQRRTAGTMLAKLTSQERQEFLRLLGIVVG